MGTITYSAYHCVIYSALKRYKQDYDALNLETIDSLSKQKESDLSFETHLFICSTRLQETQIVIVLLTCRFIEALANFYLSLTKKLLFKNTFLNGPQIEKKLMVSN